MQTRLLKALDVLCCESPLKLAHLQWSHFLTEEEAEADGHENSGENQQLLRKHEMFFNFNSYQEEGGGYKYKILPFFFHCENLYMCRMYMQNVYALCVYAHSSRMRDADLQHLPLFPPPFSFFFIFFLRLAQCVNRSCCRMESGSLLLKIVRMGFIHHVHY